MGLSYKSPNGLATAGSQRQKRQATCALIATVHPGQQATDHQRVFILPLLTAIAHVTYFSYQAWLCRRYNPNNPCK